MRATYSWGRATIDGATSVVWIVDKDEGGASVTNDVERVIADLVQLGVDPDAQPIIYRDSMGFWDRLVTRGGRFHTFQSLRGSTTLEGALKRIKELA
jgi:hypothetical protein